MPATKPITTVKSYYELRRPNNFTLVARYRDEPKHRTVYVFMTMVDALLHAKDTNTPVLPVDLSATDFMRFINLCEQHGIIQGVEGAEDTLRKNGF